MTKVLEVYRDTYGRSRCRGLDCGAWLTWYELVESGKRMCFDGHPQPESTREDLTGRLIWAIPFEANHWAHCPNAIDFKKGAHV